MSHIKFISDFIIIPTRKRTCFGISKLKKLSRGKSDLILLENSCFVFNFQDFKAFNDLKIEEEKSPMFELHESFPGI